MLWHLHKIISSKISLFLLLITSIVGCNAENQDGKDEKSKYVDTLEIFDQNIQNMILKSKDLYSIDHYTVCLYQKAQFDAIILELNDFLREIDIIDFEDSDQDYDTKMLFYVDHITKLLSSHKIKKDQYLVIKGNYIENLGNEKEASDKKFEDQDPIDDLKPHFCILTQSLGYRSAVHIRNDSFKIAELYVNVLHNKAGVLVKSQKSDKNRKRDFIDTKIVCEDFMTARILAPKVYVLVRDVDVNINHKGTSLHLSFIDVNPDSRKTEIRVTIQNVKILRLEIPEEFARQLQFEASNILLLLHPLIATGSRHSAALASLSSTIQQQQQQQQNTVNNHNIVYNLLMQNVLKSQVLSLLLAIPIIGTLCVAISSLLQLSNSNWMRIHTYYEARPKFPSADSKIVDLSDDLQHALLTDYPDRTIDLWKILKQDVIPVIGGSERYGQFNYTYFESENVFACNNMLDLDDINKLIAASKKNGGKKLKLIIRLKEDIGKKLRKNLRLIEGNAHYDTYELSDSNDNKIKLLHFKKWPDHFVPFFEHFRAFVELTMIHIRALQPDDTYSINCKEGHGRTGTFFAITRLLLHTRRYKSCNVAEITKDFVRKRKKKPIIANQIVFANDFLLHSISERLEYAMLMQNSETVNINALIDDINSNSRNQYQSDQFYGENYSSF